MSKKTYVLQNPYVVVGLAAAFLLGGCATVEVVPLSASEVVEKSQADRKLAQSEVEPIKDAISLEEAIARALKYNLDRRTRSMEESLALGQLDVSKFDMLPKLLATIGYRHRSEYSMTRAIDSITGAPSLANPSISSDKQSTTQDLGLSWSLLDFGLSYYAAKQNADRVLIAAERRRKAMHLLMQDVRAAFWRAASAQRLRADVRAATVAAEDALVDARKAEEERLRSPLDSLRYQRQVLENLRLLEAIDQELATAKTDLASLINAPLSADLKVLEPSYALSAAMLNVPVGSLESIAIENNADLREQFYNTRIAAEETRRILLRLFPNLNLNYTLKRDDDRFLIHQGWNEAGAQLSYNFLGLFSIPAQMRLADAGVALADQRRMATQLGVLAQVHIARLQYASTMQQFARADEIWKVDDKINQHVGAREKAETQSKLDKVGSHTTAILSQLRRYQALAQANAAASKLQATLGMEPEVGDVGETSLAELQTSIGAALRAWEEGRLPGGAAVPQQRSEVPQPTPALSQAVETPAAEPPAKPVLTQQPVDSVAKALSEPSEALVRSRISGWLASWAAKDAKSYRAYYAAAQDVSEINKRVERWTRSGDISVAAEDIRVTAVETDRVRTQFRQHYRSAIYRDSVVKVLDWTLENGRWVISAEAAQAAGS
jgi:outer membrane protein TolC